jgi:hypothetical protein
MEIYWTWIFTGEPESGQVRRVRLMPLPAATPVAGSGTLDDPVIFQGHLDVRLRPGTPFVMPIAVWVGETYEPDLGIPDDLPLDPSVFTESNVLITIDGRPIIDSQEDDLRAYYFGPIPFDPPFPYPEPTSYGAVGAVFAQGIGFVHHPLSRGTHTMTLHSEILIPEFNLGFVFENTWTITVE